MGCGKREQPVGRKEGIGPVPEPLASFHSVVQSRQHAFGPNRRFGPVPAGRDLSPLCRRCRHCRGALFRRHGHHASIFLPRLRSTPVTALHHYYAGSDFPPGLCPWRDLPSSRVCTSFRAVPSHPMPPCRSSPFSAFARQASRASTPLAAGHCSTRVWVSRITRSLTAAPDRIGFVSLRPGSSFPVALHLVSRQRSYRSVRSAECLRQGLAPCYANAPEGALAAPVPGASQAARRA